MAVAGVEGLGVVRAEVVAAARVEELGVVRAVAGPAAVPALEQAVAGPAAALVAAARVLALLEVVGPVQVEV
jgi:hypothetical protein